MNVKLDLPDGNAITVMNYSMGYKPKEREFWNYADIQSQEEQGIHFDNVGGWGLIPET